MQIQTIDAIAAAIFAIALLHTFSTKLFEVFARRHPSHAGLFHLLGEVEVVFGFWAMVLMVAMALSTGPQHAVAYAESRQYTEPLFVFVVMVVAASRPVLELVQATLGRLAAALPGRTETSEIWLGLALVPLLGSLITEPAAMTLAALALAPRVFRPGMPEWKKYAALGVLFVNVSIGGTLTSYAAPPVLMVASAWNWDTAFMAREFGWKAALAVLVNASAVAALLARDAARLTPLPQDAGRDRVPLAISLVHLALLAGVVVSAHHPVIFLWLFLFFLGFTRAYARYQDALLLKEGLLVGFFLAGLVVLGGMQQWWLQPLVSGLPPLTLFFSALALTAVTDNAALTYLGSLIPDLSQDNRYMLVAGAVAGGGLTVIANAPNPAGVALLRRGFDDESIGAGGLLAGALAPTAVACAAFLLL
ncbi:MAG: rane protein [Ramlibacter sp.]|jgi:hypothetical protein|nr:rane protein [Ramlibacter sp.]